MGPGLRWGWSKARFTGPSGEWKKEAEENGKSSADVAVVDEAISDDAWWHYLRMLCVFAHVEHEIYNDVIACSCHSQCDWRNASAEVRALWRRCPLKGRGYFMLSDLMLSLREKFDQHISKFLFATAAV